MTSPKRHFIHNSGRRLLLFSLQFHLFGQIYFCTGQTWISEEQYVWSMAKETFLVLLKSKFFCRRHENTYSTSTPNSLNFMIVWVSNKYFPIFLKLLKLFWFGHSKENICFEIQISSQSSQIEGQDQKLWSKSLAYLIFSPPYVKLTIRKTFVKGAK